jgi:hypothetical protein
MTRPRNLGFSSLRFDFARGYDARYIKEYVDSTVWPRGELSIGEYWDDDGGRDPAYTSAGVNLKGYVPMRVVILQLVKVLDLFQIM